MAMVIDCECGEQIHAESEEELVQKTEQHVNAHHPELVGKLSRDDILAMSQQQ